jgi:alpha-amylase/alpha-mannosidase (GH57 family)
MSLLKGEAMLEQELPQHIASHPTTGRTYLCLHGHFYQPPREEPFSGQLPNERGATPFSNFNEKITAECYQPNVDAGNFEAISFDFGPTLAAWLEKQYPDIYQGIITADQLHVARYGVGNALAQSYNHTILPLATTRDKYTQIRWGLLDFRRRFGRDAHGMWLAETAIDTETLDILAQCGVTYTVLAPWQAQEPIDSGEPYYVPLRNGRSITAFFYNAPLSGGVSFDWQMTNDANTFAQSYLPAQLSQSKNEAQLLLIATDGELYGHHKPWREKFLAHLIHESAPEAGFEVCTLERYMMLYPARKEVRLREPGAWSCGHGVERWNNGCPCTEGDSSWKGSLRRALTWLAERGDQLFEHYAGATLRDPWATRDDYLAFRNGWESAESFWGRHGKILRKPDDRILAERTMLLLEAQYYQQYSFTSCAFFFEDLDRIEPRNAIAFARRAISLYWQALGIDLQPDFVRDLQAARSWRISASGADFYRQLPPVPARLLPTLG